MFTNVLPDMDREVTHQIEVAVDTWFSMIEQTVQAQRSMAMAMLGIVVPNFATNGMDRRPARSDA